MTQMAIAALGPWSPRPAIDVFGDEAFIVQQCDDASVYDMMIADLNLATTKLQFQVSTLQQGYDPLI